MSDSPTRPVALVTGAGRGLAKGIAIALAADGYATAITYRSSGSDAAATLDGIRRHQPDPLAIDVDFVDPEPAARAAVAEVERRYGRLDVLVHAVGPIIVRRFARCDFADYRRMIDENLGSAVAVAAAALPGMRARRFGRLIFFGMNGSHVTLPALGMSLYGAAKSGVATFARTLALEEAAHGITVNLIEPGDIRAKDADRAAAARLAARNPTGHAGSWEDVAYAVRFLAAPDAGFINGVALGVNGGLVEAHE